jgi:hypothetical protein
MRDKPYTVLELWRMLRGGEDALRYQSEILGSILLSGRINLDTPIPGITDEDLAILAMDWDDLPPCRPPGPCNIYPMDVCSRMLEFARRIMAAANAYCQLTGTIDPDQITYYSSTLPGGHWKTSDHR